jgi:hypothetical protein
MGKLAGKIKCNGKKSRKFRRVKIIEGTERGGKEKQVAKLNFRTTLQNCSSRVFPVISKIEVYYPLLR